MITINSVNEATIYFTNLGFLPQLKMVPRRRDENLHHHPLGMLPKILLRNQLKQGLTERIMLG